MIYGKFTPVIHVKHIFLHMMKRNKAMIHHRWSKNRILQLSNYFSESRSTSSATTRISTSSATTGKFTHQVLQLHNILLNLLQSSLLQYHNNPASLQRSILNRGIIADLGGWSFLKVGQMQFFIKQGSFFFSTALAVLFTLVYSVV